MDADVAGALDAVELDDTAAQRFFELVAAAHAEAGGDWDRLRARLDGARGDFPAGEVERFTEYAEQAGRTDLTAKLADLGGYELASAYVARRAVPGEEPEPGADHWATLVAAHGAGWAAFTGTEESWAECRDDFYVNANELDPELYALAYHQLSPLDELPMPQRIAASQNLGLPVTADPSTPDPWETLVAAHGVGWAAFAGTEESWVERRDDFYVSANELDPELYAVAYHRLSPLDELPMPQRIAALRDLGIDVRADAAEEPAEAEDAVRDGTGLSLDEVARILDEAVLSG
jgi:hypothetical protein